MKNRLIQFHGSSSFRSLSQNIPFYQSTTTPLKPQYCIVQQRHNTDGKRKKQNGCTQQAEIVAVVVSFLFIFSSNKSLSTLEFFMMVTKNTLIVSPRHSLDLEKYRTSCKTSQLNKVYLFTVIYAEKGQF